MGLWRSKDSCIALTAFADADHAGCQDTRRSTSGMPLPYAVTMTNTQDPSILTSDTISSRSKWKMAWLSCTSSEQNISCIFTKALGRERLEFLINKLGMRKIQQTAREEAWVPKADRVNISTTNMRIDPTMTQKEETYQVILDIIKNTSFYKAFLAIADVPEIFMQQFWHIVTKIKESTFYEFKLANKKCQFDVEVFRKALDVCPRVYGIEFITPPSKEELVTFLIGLGYKGELTHLPKMLINYMHQPWRTLASIINKCLSGKTFINDRLR
ncbi:hypothetical protein Tco_0327616 [Tanacetum coccineum]